MCSKDNPRVSDCKLFILFLFLKFFGRPSVQGHLDSLNDDILKKQVTDWLNLVLNEASHALGVLLCELKRFSCFLHLLVLLFLPLLLFDFSFLHICILLFFVIYDTEVQIVPSSYILFCYFYFIYSILNNHQGPGYDPHKCVGDLPSQSWKGAMENGNVLISLFSILFN